jgi:hypothetical protein
MENQNRQEEQPDLDEMIKVFREAIDGMQDSKGILGTRYLIPTRK